MTFERFKQLASKGNRYVVIFAECHNNSALAIEEVYQKLQPHAAAASALIEFSGGDRPAYTVIGLEPMASLMARGHEVMVECEGQVLTSHGDPYQALRALRDQITAAGENYPMTQFAGAAIGYLAYDAVRYVERLPDQHHRDSDIADINLKFYRTTVALSVDLKKIIISHVVSITENLADDYHSGMTQIDALIQTLNRHSVNNALLPCQNAATPSDFVPDLNDQSYADLVVRAKKYIASGDVFQIVPSRTFKKSYDGNAFLIYKALKKLNPSPYHFYLQEKNVVIVGASPEKLVSVQNRKMTTIPLAGTRPRNSQSNDAELAQTLLSDTKEVAEHMMLIDLARNDLGAISKPGSVAVTSMLRTLSFSHVMHIASTVESMLDEKFDVIDALKATLPAGTLSGAPKIRAMQLIDQLEISRRGIYGGAIVVMDRQNNLDSCITIRTAVVKNKEVMVRVGAGIVHDSNPDLEAVESRQKAMAVMAAVSLAEQGI